MKFEEILPALKAGKKIRRKCWGKEVYIKTHDFFVVGQIITEDNIDYALTVMDLEADDWEVIKEPKKVKLRDLTKEQLEKWRRTNCIGDKCHDCIFNKVGCIYVAYCWIKDKSLFSDKFLNQEVEIEED